MSRKIERKDEKILNIRSEKVDDLLETKRVDESDLFQFQKRYNELLVKNDKDENDIGEMEICLQRIVRSNKFIDEIKSEIGKR